MKVPKSLWHEAKNLARLMSREDWQGPGVRFLPTAPKPVCKRPRRKSK